MNLSEMTTSGILWQANSELVWAMTHSVGVLESHIALRLQSCAEE